MRDEEEECTTTDAQVRFLYKCSPYQSSRERSNLADDYWIYNGLEEAGLPWAMRKKRIPWLLGFDALAQSIALAFTALCQDKPPGWVTLKIKTIVAIYNLKDFFEYSIDDLETILWWQRWRCRYPFRGLVGLKEVTDSHLWMLKEQGSTKVKRVWICILSAGCFSWFASICHGCWYVVAQVCDIMREATGLRNVFWYDRC